MSGRVYISMRKRVNISKRKIVCVLARRGGGVRVTFLV